jgi:hypothetical protein
LTDRYNLDCIINHYKELDTHTDPRPEQHKDKQKHNKRGTLITAIAITIMAIATASAAAGNIIKTAYEINNEDEQRNKEDTVSRIKRATTTKPQVTGKQACATHIKQGTRTTKQDKWGNKVDAKHDTGNKERQLCLIALLTQKYKQAREHCRKTEPTQKRETTRQAQRQERAGGTKSRA